ncbi:MAG TPA: AIM24 family protein, partial [Vicinamibacteria bacterium]
KMAAATAKQPPRPSPKAADTAKFKAAEIQAAFKRREEADPLAPPRPIQPVSPNLMVPESAVTEAGPTSRVRLAEVLIPPAAPRQEPLDPRPPRLRSAAPPVEPPTDRTLPSARRPEPFRFVQSNLMEIDFSGKVFIKQGTIYSYSGNLTFWVKEKRPGGQPALVIITGSGRVLLTDGDREITFMQVQDETIFVAPPHLLACEETLTPRYVALGDGSSTLEFLALEGTGMVALSVARKPIPIEVTRELPVSVPAVSVITWSGALQPRVLKDRQLHEIMLPGREQEPVLRLEGDGRVLVEQANVH